MTRQLAHETLDAAQRGEPISEAEISRALVATGDLAHGWPPKVTIDDDEA